MSRYIDADDAMERIKQAYEDMGVDTHGVWNKQLAEIFKSADVEDVRMCLHKILGAVSQAPVIDIVRCRECVYYDPPHVEDDGKRIEYKDLPKEAFDKLGTGFVNMSYGVNLGGRCCVDYNCGYAEDKRVYRAEDNFCSKGRRPLYSSEKPNNCEHITEDGVTCAKYPACDDCLDNPLNKVKGSERLVKGSEQTDCQTCKWWSNYGYCVHRECKGYAARKGVANESSTMDHSDCGDYQDDRTDSTAQTDSKGHGSEGYRLCGIREVAQEG